MLENCVRYSLALLTIHFVSIHFQTASNNINEKHSFGFNPSGYEGISENRFSFYSTNISVISVIIFGSISIIMLLTKIKLNGEFSMKCSVKMNIYILFAGRKRFARVVFPWENYEKDKFQWIFMTILYQYAI